MGQNQFAIAVFFVAARACICIYLGDPLDVSNVLRLEPQGDENFYPYGKLVIEVRGDARGLPVTNTSTLGPNETPCCREWSHVGWSELPPFEASIYNLLLDISTNTTQVWALWNSTGELISPPGPHNKGSNVCVTLLVRLPENSTITVYARLPTGNPRETKMVEIKGTKSNAWTVRRIERKGHRSFRNKQLQLVVKAKHNGDLPVLLQWAWFCNSNDEVSTYSFPSIFTRTNATSVFPRSGIGSGDLVLANRLGEFDSTDKSSVCLNKGRLNKEHTLCECPPGFTGGVCENGCGENRYGVHCEGKCSEDIYKKCRGVSVCSKTGGCECVAGLEGEKCDTPCIPGRYGSGCSLTCGVCGEGRVCDPYTGKCLKGCEGARLPPYCDSVCGIITPSQSLISYAVDADAEDFPWHVGIYSKQKGIEPQIVCGGTLVRPKYVLSAAHCFYSDAYMKLNRAGLYSAGFGKTHNEYEWEESHMDRVQFRDVSSLHIPELYRGFLRSFSNDIAVVKLSRPVDITQFVLPICFDWSGGYEADLPEGELGTIVGWGMTEKKHTSHTLQKADLPYVSAEECLDAVPGSFQKYVTDDKFCVGEKGDDVINPAVVNKGDSGGGLIFRQGQSWYLRGIVSVGLPDATPLTVYTNVSYFRKWITDTWNLLDLEDATH